jgi:hypothetical protein
MTTSTVIAAPDTGEVAQQGKVMVGQARDFTVDSEETAQSAGLAIRKVKVLRKQIKLLFEEPVMLAHKTHKAMVAARAKLDDAPAEAERLLKNKLGAYSAKVEQEREEEERRLRELARKEEEEKRLAEAEALEAAGETEEAEEVLNEPIEAPVVVLAPATPKIEGVSMRKVWKHRVVDEKAIPRQYMIPNDKALGQLARSLGEKAVVAGVDFYCEESVSARA